MQVFDAADALSEQRTQGGTGFGAKCRDRRLSFGAGRRESAEHVGEIARADAGGVERLARCAGRVGELAENGVERRTCAARVDAGVLHLGDDRRCLFERHPGRIGRWGGIRQGVGQILDRGLGAGGGGREHIGHAPGLIGGELEAGQIGRDDAGGCTQIHRRALGQGHDGRDRGEDLLGRLSSATEFGHALRGLHGADGERVRRAEFFGLGLQARDVFGRRAGGGLEYRELPLQGGRL